MQKDFKRNLECMYIVGVSRVSTSEIKGILNVIAVINIQSREEVKREDFLSSEH